MTAPIASSTDSLPLIDDYVLELLIDSSDALTQLRWTGVSKRCHAILERRITDLASRLRGYIGRDLSWISMHDANVFNRASSFVAHTAIRRELAAHDRPELWPRTMAISEYIDRLEYLFLRSTAVLPTRYSGDAFTVRVTIRSLDDPLMRGALARDSMREGPWADTVARLPAYPHLRSWPEVVGEMIRSIPELAEHTHRDKVVEMLMNLSDSAPGDSAAYGLDAAAEERIAERCIGTRALLAEWDDRTPQDGPVRRIIERAFHRWLAGVAPGYPDGALPWFVVGSWPRWLSVEPVLREVGVTLDIARFGEIFGPGQLIHLIEVALMQSYDAPTPDAERPRSDPPLLILLCRKLRLIREFAMHIPTPTEPHVPEQVRRRLMYEVVSEDALWMIVDAPKMNQWQDIAGMAMHAFKLMVWGC